MIGTLRLCFRPAALLMWMTLGFAHLLDAAGNFTGDDPGIVAAADQARRDSALFWSGADLPGRW
ncbi:MAG: hypothetical protein KDA75_17930, partial [Planctomycetaceae bacterium]|nr:hypothetical protein [Planctomycetaceae bacterium]